MCKSSEEEIATDLTNLLDFSAKDVKKFIREFQERIKNLKEYHEKVKSVHQFTNKLNKDSGGGTTKTTIKVRGDISKFLVAGRKICYCQATQHGLVNNCMDCGKVICEQEGQGPCLFCGTWVDRETRIDFEDDEEQAAYDKALDHRDRLIDYDINAARRLGVLDERSDWYELSNNTWLNKDQR